MSLVVPGSNNAPVSGAGMTGMFVRFGTNARVPLQATSALLNALGGSASDLQVSWNFTSGMLDVYNSGTGALAIREIRQYYATGCQVVTYNATTGQYEFTLGGAVVVRI